jgi:hypothetical protein
LTVVLNDVAILSEATDFALKFEVVPESPANRTQREPHYTYFRIGQMQPELLDLPSSAQKDVHCYQAHMFSSGHS